MAEDVTLDQALLAYDERRYLDAFALAHRVPASDDPRLVLLIARLAAIGGDMVGAVATYRSLLATSPDAQARIELTDLLSRRPNPGRAAQNWAKLLQAHPDLAQDLCAPGSQAPLPNAHQVRDTLNAILHDDPVHANALAALANADVRKDRYIEAVYGYRRSLALQPDALVRRLRLAEVLFDLGDVEASFDEFARVFAVQSFFEGPEMPGQPRVLLLFAPLPWRMNTRFDFLSSDIAFDVLYVTSKTALSAIEPGKYARIFSCIGAHDVAQDAREFVQGWIDRESSEVSNQPKAVAALTRSGLPQALAGLSGFVTAGASRVDRDHISGHACPYLLRPPDSQAGRGLKRIATSDDLKAYLHEHDDHEFDCTTYLEYRSRDGKYRKYRVVIVDGHAYPYHLAIADDWMVHYVRAGMSDAADRRDEEAAFLQNPESHIAHFYQRFASLATHLGLEYVALDCAMLGENVLIFEIDPTMLIHIREDDSCFAYRAEAVQKIAYALEAWLCREGR